MSDRYKFRVWDKELKTYLDPEHFYITGEGRGFTCEHKKGMYSMCYEYMGTDRFVIEQYTGRIDFNQKDVFKGDNVKARLKIRGKYKDAVGVVDYDKTHSAFVVKTENWGIQFLYDCMNLEVIGTIHDKEQS